MTEKEQKVLDTLQNLGIEYQRVEHPPVYTVEEANKLCILGGVGCKNLFLKDGKTKTYYLIVMVDSKRADMKTLSKKLEVSRLSFAKEEELHERLGLKPGEVTPFGLLQDDDGIVTVVLDDELDKADYVSFHPNVNTSTVLISYKDFLRFLEWKKNKVIKIEM